MTRLLLFVLALALAGCGSAPKRGGYYQDDGPLPNPPADLAGIPDAFPQIEPLRPANARPYIVLGRSYTPMTALRPYKERGLASWYGRKFHGQPTASGETYDMYKMTAAHKTLPIPSYARVTNLRNRRSVIVRVNDRGPFHDGRVIDLSYAAAVRLDKVQAGTVEVEVELLLPDEIARLQRDMRDGSHAPGPAPAEPTPVAAAGLGGETRVLPIPPTAPVATSGTGSDGPRAADGLFVQLGAYAQRANAEAVLARLSRDLPEFGALAEIVLRGAVFRVLVGPFDDPGVAVAARDRLAATVTGEAVLVDRR